MLDRQREREDDAGRLRPATYADIEAAPKHLVAEIIDGTLVTHPRPSPRHAVTSHALAGELGGPFQKGRDGPGGWVFLNEPEIKFSNDILVPDIAAWRRERLSSYPDTNWIEIAPDWLCEVLSASTEKRDRTVKLRVYAEAGVAHVWLLDPRLQILEAYELHDGSWRHLGAWNGDEKVRVAPFDAIAIALADLWPLDRPLGFAEDPQALYAGDR
jgi:Uma2 family endonuclease